MLVVERELSYSNINLQDLNFENSLMELFAMDDFISNDTQGPFVECKCFFYFNI